MKNKKLILLVVILVFGFWRLFLISHTPSQASASTGVTQIDPNQLGYIGLLQNSIIQLLFCSSLIIMLGGFSYARSTLLPRESESNSSNVNNYLFALITGVACVGAGILWSHWAYIDSEFSTLINMLMYEAYNPESAPNMSYYQWKYSLNPAKVIVALLWIPVLLPLFYFIRTCRKNQSR